jgi:hypothetical protein
MSFVKEYQQEVRTAKFGIQHAIKLQQFEWLLVRHHESTVPSQTPTAWTSAYDKTGFAKAEKRLFGEANYRFTLELPKVFQVLTKYPTRVFCGQMIFN